MVRYAAMTGLMNERTTNAPSVVSESAPGSISNSRYTNRSRPERSLALPMCKYQWVSDLFIHWVRRSRFPGSNRGHPLYKSGALPTELKRRFAIVQFLSPSFKRTLLVLLVHPIFVLDDFFQEFRPRSTSLERVLVRNKIRETVRLERKKA